MATLTLTMVAGATNARTLNFSGPDAARILAAYQKRPGAANATASDLLNFIADQVKLELRLLVTRAETVIPTGPDIT
jgi:hypothetical protein